MRHDEEDDTVILRKPDPEAQLRERKFEWFFIGCIAMILFLGLFGK